MKSLIRPFTVLLLLCFLSACRQDTDKQQDSSHKAAVETLITQNEGKYPYELDIFGENPVSERIQALTGDEFQEILQNFNTVTPVVSQDGVYKFTGCKEHDCPAFITKIYYDSNTDNFNVVVSKKGKVKVYKEKATIVVPKVLQNK